MLRIFKEGSGLGMDGNNGKEKSGKRLLNVSETAFYLGLSRQTIYNGIAPKSEKPFPVKPKRWGKRVLFDVRDLDRFADSLPYGR